MRQLMGYAAQARCRYRYAAADVPARLATLPVPSTVGTGTFGQQQAAAPAAE
ncbi:MAG: hypothetical protein WKG07_33240 [Hymenobacter sp.]